MASTLITEDSTPTPDAALSSETLEASTGFVGQWQTLVSTTNWEKGQIIRDWRTALEKSGAPVTEYSDEAWAQLVGDVTGQHVGRLRRTSERFGDVAAEYAGLYWSHFQTALDWQDAEMWLEGALQNGWSVSQMRAKRWETVGDGEPEAVEASAPESFGEESVAVLSDSEQTAEAKETAVRDADEEDDSPEHSSDSSTESPETVSAAERRQPVQPMKDLAELPEDLAEAFEQFKLAILTHKMMGWEEVSRDDILAALAALEQLALAPSGE